MKKLGKHAHRKHVHLLCVTEQLILHSTTLQPFDVTKPCTTSALHALHSAIDKLVDYSHCLLGGGGTVGYHNHAPCTNNMLGHEP